MKIKILLTVVALVVATTVITSCGGESSETEFSSELVVNNTSTPIITDEDTFNIWNEVCDSVPNNCVRLQTKYLGNLRQLFNDSNHVHYPVAESTGIKPISDLSGAWNVGKPVVKVVSCKEYYVQPLKYSLPYLIPSAERCLRELGKRFNDSLSARGGGSYRIKVTSVLRTKQSVKRLRRVNINAVDSSTHQFATTFDISASRFVCDNFKDVNRSLEDLKNLLAEIIYTMQQEKKLYIKYERKNSCFHITSRMGQNTRK